MLELDNRISLKRKPDSYDPKQILEAIALFALSLLNKYIYIYVCIRRLTADCFDCCCY